ncbi:MAG: family 43 glycosylhydrolase [Clostridia bacterium]|nr:family 43 glycosylhydrolase [Clostridia bacterium]
MNFKSRFVRRGIAALCAALLGVFSFAACAAQADAPDTERSAAENLYALGLVQGYATQDGSVNFAEGDSLTRAQSIALVVRFLGAEKEAVAGSFQTPFTDLADWAKPYVGYAYANGITKGVSESRFDTDGKITDYAFLTSILRVLGYEDTKGDFVWNDPYAPAKRAGLIESETPDAEFTRGDAFDICFAALTATPKSGERIADRLCKAGAVSEEKMNEILHKPNGLMLGETSIADCRIVLPAAAGATEKLVAETLAEQIGNLYGKTPAIVTDDTAKADGEILVGATNRALSAAGANLGQDEAALLVKDGDLCLCGSSTTWLRRVTNYFIETYLGEKMDKRLTDADSERGELIVNPIFSKVAAGDPDIVYDPETDYYYAVYSAPKNDRVTLYRAKTVGGLGSAVGKDVYVAGDDKEIKHKLYAPELHKVDGKWYIYASGATSTEDKKDAASKSIRLFCLEATSDDPFGDYRFKGFLNDTIWAIDAHVFTYKGENYVCAARILSGNTIMIARLENPWTIDTKRVSVLASATYDFETQSGKINEGPFVFEHDGRLFLLYSCNSVSSPYYSLGMLEMTGEDILSKNSWTKRTHAVFEGTASVVSPGHCSVFMSPDGSQYWLAYHIRGNGGRQVCVKQFTFDAEGEPIFGRPTTGSYFFAPKKGA